MSNKRVYRVTDHADRTLARVAAKSKQAAIKAYSKHLEAEEMSLDEIISLSQQGIGIFDAESGELIGAKDDSVPWDEGTPNTSFDAQQQLGLPDVEEA